MWLTTRQRKKKHDCTDHRLCSSYAKKDQPFEHKRGKVCNLTREWAPNSERGSLPYTLLQPSCLRISVSDERGRSDLTATYGLVRGFIHHSASITQDTTYLFWKLLGQGFQLQHNTGTNIPTTQLIPGQSALVVVSISPITPLQAHPAQLMQCQTSCEIGGILGGGDGPFSDTLGGKLPWMDLRRTIRVGGLRYGVRESAIRYEGPQDWLMVFRTCDTVEINSVSSGLCVLPRCYPCPGAAIIFDIEDRGDVTHGRAHEDSTTAMSYLGFYLRR
ncbi:hypothetical protein BKA93DRAFT_747415 [Sparassis latifolia]